MSFITRAQWGHPRASVPAGSRVDLATRDEFMAHYSTGQELGREKCDAWVREIQRFHTGPEREWDDIGYNFLVCKHGDIFEGRGWLRSGAHCPNHNTRAIGVCFLGNDDPGIADVTESAKIAFRDLFDQGVAKCGPLRKMGHRDGKDTRCPGDELYDWMHAGMPLNTYSHPAVIIPTQEVDMAALPVLHPGAKGFHVMLMQKALECHTHDLSQENGADGVHGPGSQRELNSFKVARGLPGDGVVDGPTWLQLLKA